MCHPRHDCVQVSEDVVQLTHIALGIVDLQPQLLHYLPGILGGGLQGQDNIAQVRATLCALDADVCQQAQSGGELGGAALQVRGSAAHRQDGFAQLTDVCIRLAGRFSQFVAELVHILLVGLEVQRGHSIGDQIGRIGQIHAARCGQVQDAGQHLGGLVGIVSSKRQIVQSVRCLCSSERCSAAHLLGLVRQALDLIHTHAHGGGHLGHRGLEAHADTDRSFCQLCQFSGGSLRQPGDQIARGHRHCAQALIEAACVQPGIAGNTVICHCVHLSFGARAQGHRLL